MRYLAMSLALLALLFSGPGFAVTDAWCLATTPAETILVLGGKITVQTFTVEERLEICAQMERDGDDG